MKKTVKYQPIFGIDKKIHAIDIIFPGIQSDHTAWQINLLSESIRGHIESTSNDLDLLAQLNVKKLFLPINRQGLEYAGENIAYLHQRCIERKITLILQLAHGLRAESFEPLPLIGRILSNGGELALDNFGVFGNNIYQVITTLPKYLKLDKKVMRWLCDSGMQQSLTQLVALCDSFNATLVINNPESREQMLMAHKAGAKLLQSDFLCPELTIGNLVKELSPKSRINIFA